MVRCFKSSVCSLIKSRMKQNTYQASIHQHVQGVFLCRRFAREHLSFQIQFNNQLNSQSTYSITRLPNYQIQKSVTSTIAPSSTRL